MFPNFGDINGDLFGMEQPNKKRKISNDCIEFDNFSGYYNPNSNTNINTNANINTNTNDINSITTMNSSNILNNNNINNNNNNNSIISEQKFESFHYSPKSDDNNVIINDTHMFSHNNIMNNNSNNSVFDDSYMSNNNICMNNNNGICTHNNNNNNICNHNNGLNNGNIMNRLRTPDVNIKLKVPLIHLYDDIPLKVGIIRNKICKYCSGNNILLCNKCNNDGLIPTKSELILNLKGKINGDKIKFNGYGDEKINYIPGDIILTINEISNNNFTRDGPHLYFKKYINLIDCFNRNNSIYIKHINNKILRVSIKNNIIKPNYVICIPKHGMPLKNNINKRGHLFIQFNIIFPDNINLNPYLLNALKQILPKNYIDKDKLYAKENKNLIQNVNYYELDDDT